MKHTIEKPAWQGGSLENIKSIRRGLDTFKDTGIDLPWQVTSIARKHKLTPHRAKLICTLAGIGGLV